MKKDIQQMQKNITNKNKQKRTWKKILGLLSCIAIVLTVYSLMKPAITETSSTYTIKLQDNFGGDWKTENNYTTEFNLKLHYVDTAGNSLNGQDINLILADKTEFGNTPYGFGYTPTAKDSNGQLYNRGLDLIDKFNLETTTSSNGDRYEFDHAEVLIDGEWKSFYATTGTHWNIYCYNASLQSKPDGDDVYGWRGKYEESSTTTDANGKEVTTYTATNYTITSTTEFRFVYKFDLKGSDSMVNSVGADSGITFKLYNYEGDNSETGVNANGLYKYFSFRGVGASKDKWVNTEIDADGFTANRAKVKPRLDASHNPVFDCRGKCDSDTTLSNTSLGYLFGNPKNATGADTVGVKEYSPTNTPLLKNNENGVDYYYYYSNDNAVDYDTKEDRFIVRNYHERSYNMTTYKTENLRYEFLPFNYWQGTTMNGANSMTYQHEAADIDHWYGMTMEFEFYMPKDGLLGEDVPMKFEFSGDDDVWVFIDDVLVLDLGGTHGSVDGSIDFSTGNVEGFLNWGGKQGTKNTTSIYESFEKAEATGEREWNSNNTTFKNYTKHTLKFFYLERGASVANCKIKFNIPVLEPGTLSVKKEYQGLDKYKETENHLFTLYETTSGTPQAVPNAKYTIGTTESYTNNNGQFTLKSDELAIFKLTNDNTYYVEETAPGEHSVFVSCKFNNNICNSQEANNRTEEFLMKPDSTHEAIFTNTIKSYDLKVTKKAYYAEAEEEFEFAVTLRNDDGSPVDIPDDINSPQGYIVNHETGVVTFTLNNEGYVVIKNIPLETNVTLQETKHDGYQTVIKSGDVTLVNGDTYTIEGITSNTDITVHNIPGIELPDTGGFGIFKHLIIGLSLILASIILGKSYILKLKEGGE